MLFDQYTTTKNLSNEEKIQLLNKAKNAYIKSKITGEISEIYYQGTIKVIDEEIDNLSTNKEEIEDNI
ncbi:MAG: hypothetical protein LBD75_03620 [Candidatus Peribacteria bacterium]|nr:hypothetical protein [Candidatus Peribacteria bacterium]